jgi:hypothetical protein
VVLAPLLLLLLQAPRAVTLATAKARAPMCWFLSLVIAPFLALLAWPVRSEIISLPSLSHGSPVIPPGRLAVLELAEAQDPSCIDLSAEKSQLAINPVTSQPAAAWGQKTNAERQRAWRQRWASRVPLNGMASRRGLRHG